MDDVDDIHHLAAEAGDFRHDEHIVLLQFVEQDAQFPLVFLLGAADGLHAPEGDFQVLAAAKFEHFALLVQYGLLIRAHAKASGNDRDALLPAFNDIIKHSD